MSGCKERECLSICCNDMRAAIEKLEKENLIRQDTIGRLDQAYNDAMLDLEKQINKLEEEFYFLKDKLRNTDKKPHKCPVCDGKGKIHFTLPAGGYWEQDCKSCEMKGIVWG